MNSELSQSTDSEKEEQAPQHSNAKGKSVAKRKRAEKKTKSTASSNHTKLRSWVWMHFTKEEHPLTEIVDGKEEVVGHTTRAQCKYCNTHLAANSNANGTSSLIKHIEQSCKGYPGRDDEEKGQTHLSRDGQDDSSAVGFRHWSKDACVEAATVMIVMDELPFSAIERPGFKHFCSVAVPKWKPLPCRKVIVKNFLAMYASKKEELKMELGNHCVCLTTDTWTSVQNINYMVLTAHFIDNGWKMHKRILNFCVIPNHQGVTIGKILESCLKAWNIERVLTISVDNASANKVAIDYIKKRMINWEKAQLFGGKYLHVKCLAHIVNIIVRSGLNLLDKSVASIRNAVRYVRSSSSRLDEFKACVEKEDVDCKKICVLDVPTRWNSTYIMLDTALKLRKAFDSLAEDEYSKYKGYFNEEEEPEDEEGEEQDYVVVQTNSKKRVGPPTEADWNNASVFVKFLGVFHQTTLRVSATNHPASPKAFHDIIGINVEIDELLNQQLKSDETRADKVLKEMAQKMRAKYNKYFGSFDDINQLFLVALVLDPRYKLKNFERVCKTMLKFDNLEVMRRSDQVKTLLVDLTDLYASSIGYSSSQKSKSSTEVGSGSSSGRDSQNIYGKVADMLADWEQVLENDESVVVSNEVDRYLLDPIEKPQADKKKEEFQLLLWWKLNGSKYPNLAAVAKDVLAIQVSTVASESSFSTGKRVIDPHRSSLTPKSVEALICLQNWLKSDSITNLAYVPTPEEMAWLEAVEEGLLCFFFPLQILLIIVYLCWLVLYLYAFV